MKIAISNTIPVEIVFAAGHSLMDLNNSFVTHTHSGQWIEEAEYAGFPKSLCAWIKGVYTAALHSQGDYQLFLGVEEGDCSTTKSLHAILQMKDIPILTFGYPHSRSEKAIEAALGGLRDHLGTTDVAIEAMRKTLEPIRALGVEIDTLTYKTNQVTGFENHLALVSFSDFMGDYRAFELELKTLIAEAKGRQPLPQGVRLAYLGVPPMFGDLYPYVESLGARVVFNEVQREFSMPQSLTCSSLVEQYRSYTYPYAIWERIDAIKEELARREIHGIIHYTQAFCHRALDDLVLRQNIDLPILTLEGDKSSKLDARSKLRLEAFIDMLKDGQP